MRRILLLFSFALFTLNLSMAQLSQVRFNQNSVFTSNLENGSNAIVVFENAGTSAITIEYSSDNSATWNLIVDNYAYQGSSFGFYQWAIPASLSGPILVRVSEYGNASVSAQAPATVSNPVPPYITITYPNGGETFTALSEITIRYDAHKVPLNSSFKEEFKLEVSSDNGTSWKTIAGPVTDRQFTYQLPYNFSGNILFRVSAYANASISDVTDASFSVQPNAVVNSTYRFAQNDVHGTVLAMAKDANGNIFVAGDFDFVDTILTNNIAMWNPSTGEWSKLGEGLDSAARCITVYNGEVYVGGLFDYTSATRSGIGIKKYTINSGTWSNVAAITQETTCTIACPAPYVSMITFNNGFMYVAGFFKTIEGNLFNHAAKKNLTGGTWSKLGHYNYANSYSIENALEYYFADGADAYYISENDSLVRLNVSSNAILDKYSMKINNVNHPGMMDAIKQGDTLYYLVRYYKNLTYDYYLYKFNTVTKQFGASIKINNGSSFAYPKIGIWNNKIICVLGTLGSYNSTSTSIVCIPSSLSLVFTGVPRCLILTNDNRLVIGGKISVANQASTNYTRKPVSGVCILDVNDNFGRLSTTPYFGLYSASTGLIKNGTHLYVAAGQAYIGASFDPSFGNVRTSNGKMFKGVAQWDGDSLKWRSLGTGLHKGTGGPLSYAGEVNQLIDKDTLLIAAGYFDVGDSGTAADVWTSQIGTKYIPLNNVGIWHKGSRKWERMGAGTNEGVYAMVLVGEDVYVGGRFTSAGGQSTQLARYNLLTKKWTSLNVTDEIKLMVTDGSSIFAVGQFIDQLPGGVVCNGLAKYNIASGTWENISGSYGDYGISALTLDGNYLYIANFDGHALVKFDLTSNTYVALSSPALISNGMGGNINSLAVSGNYLYIGGLFDAIGGIQSKNFAVYNLATGTFSNARRATLNQPGANGEVRQVSIYGNEVYAAGAFTLLNNKLSSGIGSLAITGSVTGIHHVLPRTSPGTISFAYPNPAVSEVWIKEQEDFTEVKIIDQLGQVVKSIQLIKGSSINVNDLKAGMYELILSGEQGQKTQKLIIQR